MVDNDGVDEAVEGAIRIAFTAAGRVAEQRARRREAEARAAQSASVAEARELRGRHDAENAAARALVAPVGREGWLDTATPEDLAAVYETAAAWPRDEELARVATAVEEHVSDRYGVDITTAAPGAVRDLLERGEEPVPMTAAARAELDAVLRADAAPDAWRDAADAVPAADPAWVAMLEEAVERYGDTEHVPPVVTLDEDSAKWGFTADNGDRRSYDSELQARGGAVIYAEGQDADDVQRRAGARADALAADRADAAMEARHDRALLTPDDHRAALAGADADPEAVEAAVLGRVHQARPAAEATAQAPGRAPRARKARGVGKGAEAQLDR